MKRLAEYPTPRTDSCQGSDGSVPECDELCECSRDLERKLTLATEALEWCHKHAQPALTIRDEVTGPALKLIR